MTEDEPKLTMSEQAERSVRRLRRGPNESQRDDKIGASSENTPGYVEGAPVLGYVSPGMVPAKPGGVNAAAREGALAAAKAMVARKRAEQEETAKRTELIAHGFVRCRHCDGPAFWLRNYRRGEALTKDNWESSYKALGEPYFGRIIYCQVCSAEGNGKREVHVLHSEDFEVFWPKRHQVEEIPTEEFDALLEVAGGAR